MFCSLIISALICANGQSAPHLGTSGDFTILAKTGVTTTGVTTVTGDIGVSPVAATAATGFDLIHDRTSSAKSIYVVGGGRIYASDYDPPTPARLSTAVSDMQTAYTAAAGGNGALKSSELADGEVDGLTLEGGVHKWSSSVNVPNSLTFDALNDSETVWIMQIAQSLTLKANATIVLTNGAQASKIFWQVAGETKIDAGAHAKGILLCKTAITFGDGASLTGRALSQTAVTMIATTIQPDA